ncbi:MAG: S41 family peptidase [Planctomycetota bacterium]
MHRNRGRTVFVLAAGLAAGLAGACGCSGSGESTTVEANEPIGEPGAYLADFDKAWELVRDTHYDTEYNGVDWEALREELRPQAEQNRTLSESRALINEMVGRLNQSHFGVIPEAVDPNAIAAEASRSEDADAPAEVSTGGGRGDLGLTLRVVDGRALVTHVRSAGPADDQGVRMGWALARVRDREIDGIISRLSEALGEDMGALYVKQTLDAVMSGRVGSTVPVTFLDANDREVTLDLVRETPPGQMVKFGNLPPMSTHLSHRWLTPEEIGSEETRIGYIAFNIFMIPIAPQFEQAMVEYQDADGIIVDLRGNPGGVGAMSGALTRFFVTEKQNLGTMQMRGAKLEFNAEPIVVTRTGERLRPFTGPVAMLQDGTSASTSEVWAGGMRAIGRAQTFGTSSAGMALPAAMTKLPSGDVLLHAIADYTNSDGTRLEGDGVPADFEVPVRRDDLLDGIDAPLREAARWIVNQPAATTQADS